MDQSEAIGLFETDGLVSALSAADEMLKSGSVRFIGREETGTYVMVAVAGNLKDVEAAITKAKGCLAHRACQHIAAAIITAPHAELHRASCALPSFAPPIEAAQSDEAQAS